VHSQLTAEDFENYGTDLIDMTRRAAVEATAPALNALRQENHQLRQMAVRSQNASIQQELDRALPGWREEVYSDPRFSSWLSDVDSYNGVPRTQLLRQAVAAGDAARVVRLYKGFLAEAGYQAPPVP
jgi:hypothetical protein